MTQLTTIALFGAGGKMGFRCAERLSKTDGYSLRCIETGEAGAARLRAIGLTGMTADEAVRDADAVLMAIPDRAIGTVLSRIVPGLKPGALVLLLDPAAAHAGELPARADISYFIAHPCHPPLINDEVGDARRDFFGGVAKQHMVCALMQGGDADYALGERVARVIYGPVMNAYRVTVAQMAMLEPALVETTLMACLSTMKEAVDEAIRRGVPAEAAREFALGHMNVAVGVIFGYSGGVFSDGALLAMARGRRTLFRDDWKRVFDEDNLMEQVREIVDGGAPAAPGTGKA